MLSGQYLAHDKYNNKQSILLHKENGLLNETLPANPPNPLMNNPNMLMDMMKGNMTYMIPNIAMMTFVSYFFSGFVCLKLPFSLPSNRFKVMLQRDVDLRGLDVSYVTALSWYFLLTFGLNGIYRLLLGGNGQVDENAMLQMQVSSVLETPYANQKTYL